MVSASQNVFFLVLFWTARLYADASLQIVYLVLGFMGWWEWLHGKFQMLNLTVSQTPTAPVPKPSSSAQVTASCPKLNSTTFSGATSESSQCVIGTAAPSLT